MYGPVDRYVFSGVLFGVLGDLFGSEPVVHGPLVHLEQVGQVIGVTKERVRQIQNKALEKIRTALQAANPDAAVAMADDIAAREGRTPPSAN